MMKVMWVVVNRPLAAYPWPSVYRLTASLFGHATYQNPYKGQSDFTFAEDSNALDPNLIPLVLQMLHTWLCTWHKLQCACMTLLGKESQTVQNLDKTFKNINNENLNF